MSLTPTLGGDLILHPRPECQAIVSQFLAILLRRYNIDPEIGLRGWLPENEKSSARALRMPSCVSNRVQ